MPQSTIITLYIYIPMYMQVYKTYRVTCTSIKVQGTGKRFCGNRELCDRGCSYNSIGRYECNVISWRFFTSVRVLSSVLYNDVKRAVVAFCTQRLNLYEYRRNLEIRKTSSSSFLLPSQDILYRGTKSIDYLIFISIYYKYNNIQNRMYKIYLFNCSLSANIADTNKLIG